MLSQHSYHVPVCDGAIQKWLLLNCSTEMGGCIRNAIEADPVGVMKNSNTKY